MKFVKNMKIRSKLSGAFILLLMLMLLIGGLAIKQLGGTDELTDVIQNNTIPSIVMAGKMESLLQKKRLLVMKFVAARDARELEPLIAENRQLDEGMEQIWQRYNVLINSQEKRQAFDAYQTSFKEYDAMLQEKLLPAIQGTDKSQAYPLLPVLRGIVERASSSIDSLISINQEGLRQQTKELLSSNHNAITTISLTLICSLIIGVILTLLISRLIVTPLLDLVDKAQQVANGHLDVKITIHSQDEVGQMGQAFATMVSQLRGTIQKLAENALLLASASSQMQNASEQIASSSEEVVAQAITVATAGEELVFTTADIANNCHAAASNSEASRSTTLSGMEVVKITVKGIRERNEKAKVDAESVTALGKRTEQIGSIVATIQNIAAQTNLLALNAAVEAARAGEQGRGFAVVAGEVRALAQRSAGAAKEIRALIGTSVSQVADGSRQMAEAGQTIAGVVSSVSRVSDLVRQISQATAEQSIGIGQVNEAVAQLETVTQQNAALVEQTAASAEALKGNSVALSRSVQVFRIR